MRAFSVLLWIGGCGQIFFDAPPDASSDVAPDAVTDSAVDVRDVAEDTTQDITTPDGGPDVAAVDASPDVVDASPDVASDSGVLTGRGLLVRYPMTFGESDVLNSTGPIPFPLSPRDSNANLMRLVTPTGAALSFAVVGAGDGYCATIDGGPLTQLNGSMQGTIEVIAAVDAATSQGSRLVHIGEDNLWGFSLAQDDQNLVFSMNGSTQDFGRWAAPPLGTRVVLTVVVDTSLVLVERRLLLYINGIEALNELSGLGDIETINVTASSIACVGNRGIGGRTPEGTIYYVAYYRSALTSAEVMQNVSRLLVNDDPE